MKPEKTRSSRRSALKILAAAGVVTSSTVHMKSWVKPVVDSVLLPAHAQTSGPDGAKPRTSIEDPCFLTIDCGSDPVVVEATGQVTGTGNVSGLDINVEFFLDNVSQGTRSDTTGPDGSWGPVSIELPDGVTEGTVRGRVTSSGQLFIPDICQQSFRCPTRVTEGCDQCEDPNLFRIKSTTGIEWESDPGVGNNDCFGFDTSLGTASKADGGNFATISGDLQSQTVTLTRQGCWIVKASHKAANNCFEGSISGDCQSVTFTANPQDISHVEVIVACCQDE